MSDGAANITAARAEVTRARAQLSGTLATVQERLTPRRLMDEAKRGVVEAGGAIGTATQQAVRRRPGTVATAAAVAGLFLARRRIAGLFRRDRKATAGNDAS